MKRIALGLLGTGLLVASCGGSDNGTTSGALSSAGQGGAAASGSAGSVAHAGGAAGASKAGAAGAGTGGSGGSKSGGAGTSGGTNSAGTSGGGTSGGGTSGAGTSGGGSTSGAGTSSGAGAPSGGASGCVPQTGSGVFSAPNVWTKDVYCEPVASQSKSITDALVKVGGWGTGADKFQIDTSLLVLHADASTPTVPFTTNDPSGVTPDCDLIDSMPLPTNGQIEGPTPYAACDPSQGDCHLLVANESTSTLIEIYGAQLVGGTMTGACAVKWDLGKIYPDNLRGEQCTSADAAGFPIAAMVPDADEVASGTVTHALRFTLPNASMANKVYVHPASHAGDPSGDPSLPPYGVRFRLRPDYPLASLPSDAARTLAVALQHYGMFLADGGSVPLTIQSDLLTTHKWADLNLDSHALFGITPSDFDVVDLEPTVALTYDCVRNP